MLTRSAGVGILTTHTPTERPKMTTLALYDVALNLASRIATYCHVNALSLDGMVAELDNGATIDAAFAARLTSYCDAHALTLGGMVSEVWTVRFALINAEQEAQMRECMGNRETYDIAGIREVVAFYENKIGVNSNGAKVARAVLAERLAELPTPKIDYAFATKSAEVIEHAERLGLVMRLRSLLDMRADFEKRGKLVLLEKTTALIDALCAPSE